MAFPLPSVSFLVPIFHKMFQPDRHILVKRRPAVVRAFPPGIPCFQQRALGGATWLQPPLIHIGGKRGRVAVTICLRWDGKRKGAEVMTNLLRWNAAATWFFMFFSNRVQGGRSMILLSVCLSWLKSSCLPLFLDVFIRLFRGRWNFCISRATPLVFPWEWELACSPRQTRWWTCLAETKGAQL